MTLSHLDDDALSAALDGEATAEEESHLATCAACRARIEALRSVVRLLSAPVPPRPVAAVDSAIRAAIDTQWSSEGGDHAGAGRAGAVGADGADGAGVRPLGRRRPGTGRRRRGRADGRPSRTPRTLVAAAVILAFLGGLVSILARGSQRDASTTSLGVRPSQSTPAPGLAAPSDQARGQAGAKPSAGGAVAAAPTLSNGPVEQGRDLGAQSDPAIVAHLVDNELSAGGSALAQARASAAGSAVPATSPCVVQGATAAGLAGQQATLVYVAPVRWRGVDAMVLVYRNATGTRAGVVMRVADCTPLADLPV